MSAPHSEYERQRMIAEHARGEGRGPVTGVLVAVGVIVLLAIVWMFSGGGEGTVGPDGAPVMMDGAEPGATTPLVPEGAAPETIPAPAEPAPAQ